MQDIPFRIIPNQQQSKLRETVVEGLRVHTIGALRALNLYEKSGEITLFHARKDWPVDRSEELSKVRRGYILGYISHTLQIGMHLFFKRDKESIDDSRHVRWTNDLDLASRKLAQYYQVDDLLAYFDDHLLLEKIKTDEKVQRFGSRIGVSLESNDVTQYVTWGVRAFRLARQTRNFVTFTGMYILSRKFVDSQNFVPFLNKELGENPISDEELRLLKANIFDILIHQPERALHEIPAIIQKYRTLLSELPEKLTTMCGEEGIALPKTIDAANATKLVTKNVLFLLTAQYPDPWKIVRRYVASDQNKVLHRSGSGLPFLMRLQKL